MIGSLLVSAILVARQPRPQPRPRRAYAQGALLFSQHPAASATYHRVDPNLSGHTWVVSGAAGRFLNPSVALEGELAYGGFVSAGPPLRDFICSDYIPPNPGPPPHQILPDPPPSPPALRPVPRRRGSTATP